MADKPRRVEYHSSITGRFLGYRDETEQEKKSREKTEREGSVYARVREEKEDQERERRNAAYLLPREPDLFEA